MINKGTILPRIKNYKANVEYYMVDHMTVNSFL